MIKEAECFSFFLYDNINIEVLILMVQNEILKNKVNFQLQAIFTLNKRQTTNLFPMM